MSTLGIPPSWRNCPSSSKESTCCAVSEAIKSYLKHDAYRGTVADGSSTSRGRNKKARRGGGGGLWACGARGRGRGSRSRPDYDIKLTCTPREPPLHKAVCILRCARVAYQLFPCRACGRRAGHVCRGGRLLRTRGDHKQLGWTVYVQRVRANLPTYPELFRVFLSIREQDSSHAIFWWQRDR